MNITALNCIYVHQQLPKDQGNQAQVLLCIGYCVVTMLMAWSCSGLTLTMDWRFEALFWYGAPLLLALLIDFPESWKTALSLPVAVGKKLHVQKTPVPDIQRDDGKNLTLAENRNIVARLPDVAYLDYIIFYCLPVFPSDICFVPWKHTSQGLNWLVHLWEHSKQLCSFGHYKKCAPSNLILLFLICVHLCRIVPGSTGSHKMTARIILCLGDHTCKPTKMDLPRRHL